MARTQLHFKQLGELPAGPERDCFVYADAIDGVFARGRTGLMLLVAGQYVEVIGDYDHLIVGLWATGDGRIPESPGGVVTIVDGPEVAALWAEYRELLARGPNFTPLGWRRLIEIAEELSETRRQR